MGSCTIIKTDKGRFVEDTVPFIQNILHYFKINLALTFKEFVVDFIRDESGIYWFINLKAFVFDEYKLPI